MDLKIKHCNFFHCCRLKKTLLPFLNFLHMKAKPLNERPVHAAAVFGNVDPYCAAADKVFIGDIFHTTAIAMWWGSSDKPVVVVLNCTTTQFSVESINRKVAANDYCHFSIAAQRRHLRRSIPSATGGNA